MARYIVGDVLDVLATLPDDSVDLVVTSPPFLALRSYLPAEDPQKHLEIGCEPTPGEFLDTLLDLTEEWARVLAPHGSICVELGDTYSGSATAAMTANDRPQDGGYSSADRVKRDGHKSGIRNMNDKRQGGGKGWPEAKSLCLIPELYRFALAYGFNPLTGRTTPPWRVRNVVRWHRPNPPVGALGDKFRPSTTDMVIACKSKTRYFDLDAVRAGPTDRTDERSMSSPKDFAAHEDGQRGRPTSAPQNPAGAPPLDTWIIPTAPYKGSHYATFPPALVVKPILSMCPERVCRVCGEPSRRITDGAYVEDTSGGGAGKRRSLDEPGGNSRGMMDRGPRLSVARTTTGWTDCGHNAWRNGVVLDPFAGSGTTLAVAVGHGRDAIGIDLDERNAELARERVGMFLAVTSPVAS